MLTIAQATFNEAIESRVHMSQIINVQIQWMYYELNTSNTIVLFSVIYTATTTTNVHSK